MSKIEIMSMIAPPARTTVDPYGLNPLAEDYRGVNDVTYATASSKAGPPPKMFQGGTADLPVFTASGIEPRELLKLPYTARHYAAAVGSRAQVHRLFEDAAGDPYFYLECPDLHEAAGRVRAWAAGSMDRSS